MYVWSRWHDCHNCYDDMSFAAKFALRNFELMFKFYKNINGFEIFKK